MKLNLNVKKKNIFGVLLSDIPVGHLVQMVQNDYNDLISSGPIGLRLQVYKDGGEGMDFLWLHPGNKCLFASKLSNKMRFIDLGEAEITVSLLERKQ